MSIGKRELACFSFRIASYFRVLDKGMWAQQIISEDCLFIFLPLYNLFNPLALRALPLYSLQEHRRRGLKSSLFFLCCFATPCNATGHGRERGEYSILLLLLVLLFLPCVLQCKISPIWLRHTEEEFKVTLYSFATSRGRGYFTPLLYMANTVLRNTTGHGKGGGVN